MKTYVAIAISLLFIFSCSTKRNEEYKLGQLTFEVTGLDEAKPSFRFGHLLLHSFEYQDAAEAFQEAQKIDPDFTMAYWGEAMTYNHSIWQEQDFDMGKSTLLKLGETPEARIEKAKTELEKDFIRILSLRGKLKDQAFLLRISTRNVQP